MDAIRKLSDVFKDAKNEKVDRSRMLTLYEALLILQQNTGREFLDALAAYVSSAERTAPILERDFRLNKVGEKSVAVVGGLRTVEQALNRIRSTLTLNDGDFITRLLALHCNPVTF